MNTWLFIVITYCGTTFEMGSDSVLNYDTTLEVGGDDNMIRYYIVVIKIMVGSMAILYYDTTFEMGSDSIFNYSTTLEWAVRSLYTVAPPS